MEQIFEGAFTYDKKTVAREHMNLAIRLFFEEAPICSVHLLVASALEILKNLSVNIGVPYPLNVEQVIKPEKLKKWQKEIRKPQNFVKHAVSDPHGKIRIHEGLTAVFLIEAINAYAALYKKSTRPMLLFQGWFMGTNPEPFSPTAKRHLWDVLNAIGIGTEDLSKQKMLKVLENLKALGDDEINVQPMGANYSCEVGTG